MVSKLDKVPTSLCVPCMHAKSHRASFSLSKSHATHIGYLIHSDVCYVGIPSITGEFTMFVLFVDDYSRYMTIYLLRTKADATSAFIDFETKLFNKTGKHISILRSDNGKEYINTVMANYCSEFGITHQTSTAYTPQQNGRAERPNRSVLEGMSSLLHDSKLPYNVEDLQHTHMCT